MKLNVLHIFHNPGAFHLSLMGAQRALGANARGLYYATRHMPMQRMDVSFIHAQNSTVHLRRSPLFFYSRIRKAGTVALYHCADNRPDIVHAHMLFSDGSLALDMHERFDIPYLVAVRNTDLNTRAFWRSRRMCARGMKVLDHASAVVFLTPVYRDKLLARLPAKLSEDVARKSIISMNGVDHFWHDHAYTSGSSVLGEPVRIITVGEICDNKNQLTVARAIQSLRDQGENVVYRIVGKPCNKKVVQELERYDFVTLESYCDRDKLLEHYRNSDIFVLPSIHESFGLVYAEAMTQGLPLVYTRGEGFDGQFPDGEVGFPVEPLSLDSVATAMEKIKRDYARLSESCSRNAARFDWNTIAQSYVEDYQAIIASAKARYFDE